WCLITAGTVHMAGETIELRPVTSQVARVLRIGRHAHRLEPVGPAGSDVRNTSQRLDIVDNRRLAKEPLDGRERRLDPRPGPLALQAFDQPRLFTADISRSAAVDIDIER